MRWYDALTVGNGVEDFRAALLARVEGEDGSDVTAAIAIIRRRPNCDELLIEHVLNAFVNQLVGPADQLQLVPLHEVLRDERAEQPSSAARALSPRVHVLRVAPDEVAERSFVRNLNATVDRTDLVQSFYFRAQAAMHRQDGLVDDRGDGEQIEDAAAVLPGVDVSIFRQALVVESVHFGDLPRLVVSSE